MTIYQRANGFIQSAWLESKKVTWPTRQELTESTRVVLVASFVVMIYLFIVDRILTLFLNFFYR